jgi:hypothetical protein
MQREALREGEGPHAGLWYSVKHTAIGRYFSGI